MLQKINIDQLNDLSFCENGYYSVTDSYGCNYKPAHVLNCVNTSAIPFFESCGNSTCERGVMLLNNVLLYKGYCFILENSALEYNFFNKQVSLLDVNNLNTENVITINDPVCLPLPDKYHHNNYGAFLLQIPPLIQRCLELGIPADFMLCSLTAWQKNILNFYFQDKLKIHDLTYRANLGERDKYSYFFKKVYVPIGDRVNFLSQYSLQFLRGMQKYQTIIGKKTYLSRITKNTLNRNHRCFLNEQKIAAILIGKGFSVIEPEDLTIEAVNQLMQESEYVFGAGGAGMFNTVFCKPSTKVLSIETIKVTGGLADVSGGWARHHSRIFSRLNLDYSIVIGQPIIDKQETLQANFVVDEEKFEQFITQAYKL